MTLHGEDQQQVDEGNNNNDDNEYVPRPLVMARPANPSILTRNFKADYEGRIGSKVLEDEMFMSEILEMAADLCIEWRRMPIAHLPAINIHWEYGMCFPMGKYYGEAEEEEEAAAKDNDDNDDDDDDNDSLSSLSSSSSSSSQQKRNALVFEKIMQRVSSVSQCAMFLHPTRYSMMLWVMDAESREIVEEADGPLPEDWTPTMVLAHEFSLLPCLFPHGYPNHVGMHRLVGQEQQRRGEMMIEGIEDLLLTPGCFSIQVGVLLLTFHFEHCIF
jgi:hypothetical protein